MLSRVQLRPVWWLRNLNRVRSITGWDRFRTMMQVDKGLEPYKCWEKGFFFKCFLECCWRWTEFSDIERGMIGLFIAGCEERNQILKKSKERYLFISMVHKSLLLNFENLENFHKRYFLSQWFSIMKPQCSKSRQSHLWRDVYVKNLIVQTAEIKARLNWGSAIQVREWPQFAFFAVCLKSAHHMLHSVLQLFWDNPPAC